MQTLFKERLKEVSELLDKNPEACKALSGQNLYGKFQASECLLIEAYEHSIDTGIDIPCNAQGGYIEFGSVLHGLNYPDSEWKSTVDKIVWILNLIEGRSLPPSKISPALYQKIKQQAGTTGVVAPDGTLYGESKYEQLDAGWLTALFYFLYYRLLPEKVHPFGCTPRIAQLAGSRGETRIAIIGDWGTGSYGEKGGPAVAVMGAIQALNPQPDYLIHMGDVYYAGTEGLVDELGEEQENFMNLWPRDRWGGQAKKNTSFTLNSNHEMYDGANGYFKVALADSNTPFAVQNTTSYFALFAKPWLILGLDSAYYADPDELFMVGGLGDPNGDQTKWVGANFGHLKGKNVIVLTHHNGISNDGSKQEPIWAEMAKALNGRPDYWYWGHIHNGIVYANTLPAVEGVNVRCIGHGAIPYGKAWGLEHAAGIEYYGQTPESDGSVRVRNGFAVITLKSDGTLSEVFYEVEDGTHTPVPVWSS